MDTHDQNGEQPLTPTIFKEEFIMDTRFAISEYPDAAALNAKLNALIEKPIYSINRDALKD